MLTLNDGRSELWQWDTGRTLTVDTECSQVHFSNKVFGRSIDVDVVDEVAEIPDILLQADKELTAWAFVGTPENGYTKISKTFKVNRRNKPADYVFTPPEQTTLGEILERLDEIESEQDPDAIKNAVEDYLDNNPIRIEETDPTVPTWAKQPAKPQYTAAEVGALPDTYTPPAAPVQSVNGKTGAVNLTAEDVGALTADTEIPAPGITEETDPTVEAWAKTAVPAEVGQYFKVSAVDENGNVTAVEAVDAPSGGGGEVLFTLTADEINASLGGGVSVYDISAFQKIEIYSYLGGVSGAAGTPIVALKTADGKSQYQQMWANRAGAEGLASVTTIKKLKKGYVVEYTSINNSQTTSNNGATESKSAPVWIEEATTMTLQWYGVNVADANSLVEGVGYRA